MFVYTSVEVLLTHLHIYACLFYHLFSNSCTSLYAFGNHALTLLLNLYSSVFGIWNEKFFYRHHHHHIR